MVSEKIQQNKFAIAELTISDGARTIGQLSINLLSVAFKAGQSDIFITSGSLLAQQRSAS